MKKTIKLAVVAALALGATSAFATNGSTLIGVGAKARGMGGVGIGMSHGAESALVNPAMITSVKGTEVSFGGTVFMPSVSNDLMGAGAEDSAADLSVIPSVSLASKVTDNFYMGIGMWGTAGMGTDYRKFPANMGMVTNLQLMQFGVPLAYKVDGLSLAVTPLVQYGALDINYAGQAGPGTSSSTQGVAQNIQIGYTLGAAYEVDGFTIGAVYKSEIEMKYDGQISQAMSDFTGDPASMFSDKLSTPEEIGIGVSYNIDEHTFAVDYKRINWSKAKGYEDFAWSDQDVYVVGYEYATKDWAGRLGYNYAKSPISDQGAMGVLPNTLNLLGFPAIVESHIAVGGTYNMTEQTSFDFAYVHALEKKETFAGMAGPVTTIHSQSAVTAQVNFAF